MRDSTHYGRTEEDATNDFGNNTRLLELLERPVEQATEDDDDSSLVEKSAWWTSWAKIGDQLPV